jgi:hypothetical protein
MEIVEQLKQAIAPALTEGRYLMPEPFIFKYKSGELWFWAVSVTDKGNVYLTDNHLVDYPVDESNDMLMHQILKHVQKS